jgi:Domain of unknown function (DUF1918)
VHAAVGDRLVVRGAHLGVPVREGEVVEVRATDGEPPYLVRWTDTGSTSLVCPGPDAVLEHGRAPVGR